MRLEIKQIKNITQLKGYNRWSINFTDGSNLVLRNPIFPFKIVDSQGMIVHFFLCGKTKEALFGWPGKENSIVLHHSFEWSKKYGFDLLTTSEEGYLNSIEEVIDKRKPGKPIILKIDKEGDIISP